MDLIIVSFFTAVGILIVLCKAIGTKRVVRWQVVFDAAVTFGLPLFFLGTFSGMVTAFLAGLWFSGMLFFLSLFIKPDAHSPTRSFQRKNRYGS